MVGVGREKMERIINVRCLKLIADVPMSVQAIFSFLTR
jgi:hypothetical protein